MSYSIRFRVVTTEVMVVGDVVVGGGGAVGVTAVEWRQLLLVVLQEEWKLCWRRVVVWWRSRSGADVPGKVVLLEE